ncbi:tandem-type lipoprotein [Staphylococcus gallinarum]|uniref:tandem-type lipoprotein n=1 Tax=Staphylococcus TaxID=1279 RepID=UPI000D1E4DD7|nr:tandem-type lipoprotein [Staphylococcus gallinarum]MCD8820523.1 tandem-type lipoprotein [Staphylococcus gallinarum]PTK91069.1 tandem-type lipoprotein [Staphylococcus gallinarum]PTL09526.1 tandem-type lipoprotein [Staphylococcus gallinarum]PTL09863.1 tandem-type lipoprotein [Staphylococcus gallinarum]RIL32834.1 tandem-type lipoprotein [Staphylococcus gallinarum]
MKHSRRLIVFASFLILTIFIGGCGGMTKEGNKEEKIKKSFEKTLSMYPIKNLEDLYDKEGYRDEEFDKDDKGTWLLHSEMAIQRKGENLETRGMVLKINRNTQTSKGDYITNKITYDNKGRPQNNKKKYPIKMENNKIIPIKKIEDSKIKREIDEFKFFAQYADFKELKDYKNGNISYNPNVPSYSAEYDLENSDYNVKQLRERYDIPTKQAPKLLLKGTGDLKGSSVGTKDVEFTFIESKKENIYFSDSMYFNPSEDN